MVRFKITSIGCTWHESALTQAITPYCALTFINPILCSYAFGDFRKKTPKRTWLCAGISPLLYGLRTWSKRQKTQQVFKVCTRKKSFASGVRVFCEWRRKWRTSTPPWPTLPGPGFKPLGGSISLQFLLETRLQSESFYTLDDLMGFQFQKLWYKLLKIFD